MSTHAGIAKTPEVLSGKPRIEDIRVGVLQIGDYVREVGMDIETVMDELRSRRAGQGRPRLHHPDEVETLHTQREAAIQQLREQSRAPDA